MKRILLAASLLIPALAFACAVDHLTVKDPYIRAMPEGQKTTAAYLDIANDSDKAIELIGVTSAVADKVELHEVVTTKGVAKMQQVKSITLAPKASTSLKPGGMHLMLIGLKETLKPGSVVPVTLTFGDETSAVVEMTVRDTRSDAEHGHSH
jgi:periplasmic copper chaperone A